MVEDNGTLSSVPTLEGAELIRQDLGFSPSAEIDNVYKFQYVRVDGPGGVWAEIWGNYPMRVTRVIARLGEDGGTERLVEMFRRYPIIRSWNLRDLVTGEKLPLPQEDPESIFAVSRETYGWLIQSVLNAPDELAKATSPNSRGR